jgi:hypothetical protein
VTPDHERRREALTMALYVSLSQLAVMAALPSSAEAAVVIALTSVGLILAHRLAFRLSSRLVDQGRLSAASLELLGAQLAGGLAVTVVAVVPVALLPAPYDIRVAQMLLLAFVAVVGYASARAAGHSRGRAVVEVASVVAAATLVLWVKALASY